MFALACALLLLQALSPALAGALPRPLIRTGDSCTSWYDKLEPTRNDNMTFRNIKWFGAKGDGVTDDTAAFQNALTYNRSPLFSLSTPLVLYVPPGDYIVTSTLTLYFLTHMVGNSLCPPRLVVPPGTLRAPMSFVLSGDTSYDGEHDDEFYRGVRHIDIVLGAGNTGGCGVHWAVSQATFLRDMVIDLGADGQYGIFDENGSGGFASDLTILGGQTGLQVGNQQWTWVNVSISGSRVSCVNQIWNWVSAFQGLTLADCPIGIQLCGSNDGGLLLLDSSATNVPLVLQTVGAQHIFLERFTATNVTMIASTGLPGLPGGSLAVPGWRQGPQYSAGGALDPTPSGKVPLTRADAPLPRRSRPTFDSDPTPPVCILSFGLGCAGNGVADCTAALVAALAAPGSPAVFFPFGSYLLSATVTLPPGAALVGELGSVLLALGNASAFADAARPAPLLLVPPASTGVRLVDLLFSLTGEAPGLVFVDWRAPGVAPSGLWDVSWRLYYGASDLLLVQGEGAGVFFEEGWGWVADHDINSGQTITVKNPRGMTITGTGASLLIATAMEHSAQYQYNFSGAPSVTTIVTQTETNYWSVPPSGWAMVHESSTVQMYGQWMRPGLLQRALRGWDLWALVSLTLLPSLKLSPYLSLYCRVGMVQLCVAATPQCALPPAPAPSPRPSPPHAPRAPAAPPPPPRRVQRQPDGAVDSHQLHGQQLPDQRARH